MTSKLKLLRVTSGDRWILEVKKKKKKKKEKKRKKEMHRLFVAL